MPAIAQRAPQEATRSYRPPREVAELTCEALFGPLSTLEARYAPPCLWVAGDPGLAQATLRVSIVGSRKASAEGRRRATKLAGQLANAGVVIVSGLAEGIDDAAHRAAIDASGRTIAVIGTTLERCYPPKQAALQTKIYQDHLLVSQFDPRQPTYPSGFVKRNRLMALMSQASVVVEAGDSSGTLSQAAETVRLGRPLFIMRSLAERRDLDWPARFIAKGAIVLDDVEQVISALSVQQTI
ncbi:MAG: DNA-processing protein DprA, partial [Myxococcales bacterium]|nr:DNA-processing protein DprA [Myxococcales bacterium]